MKDYMTKRTKLIAYFILEALGSVCLLYLVYLMFGSLGVLIGSIVCISIIKKVDKMLK